MSCVLSDFEEDTHILLQSSSFLTAETMSDMRAAGNEFQIYQLHSKPEGGGRHWFPGSGVRNIMIRVGLLLTLNYP